jgi:hypothetical protein
MRSNCPLCGEPRRWLRRHICHIDAVHGSGPGTSFKTLRPPPPRSQRSTKMVPPLRSAEPFRSSDFAPRNTDLSQTDSLRRFHNDFYVRGDDGFGASVALGAMTGSGIEGGLLGGSLVGGMIGAAMASSSHEEPAVSSGDQQGSAHVDDLTPVELHTDTAPMPDDTPAPDTSYSLDSGSSSSGSDSSGSDSSFSSSDSNFSDSSSSFSDSGSSSSDSGSSW